MPTNFYSNQYEQQDYFNNNPFVSYNSLGELPKIVPTEQSQPTPSYNNKLDYLYNYQQNYTSKDPIEKDTETPLQNNNVSSNSQNTYMNYKPSSGNVSRRWIADYLMNKHGLKEHHARAIAGNLWQESAGKIGIVGKDKHDKSGSFGLAQWTLDRRKKLHDKYGDNPTAENQLDYLMEELNTTENRAYQKLLATNDVNSATEAFMKHFERPSADPRLNRLDNRIKYANTLD